ncbi:cyclic nucleotide-binding domain-containing protein [Actinomadura chokoriensis]|uniref:Cyclic nucleotide-binding domain-containing protein n=1 Tax=Actinomadura chokoriensis TaxID=454156 RepID=A0ABV4QV45_9ACTN
MDEHARRHDPDEIVRPQPQAAVHPRQAHGEPSTENTGLETRKAVPPASGLPGGSSQRPGFWLSLTTIEKAEFLATAQEVVYAAGTVLWEEGQAADQTIVIKFGSVRVSIERDGRKRIIAFRGPGDIIGERAALMLRRRSATIVAMEPLHALRVTTQQFVTYLSNHPRVVAVMEREMYERLTEQSGHMHGPQSVETGMEQYRAAHSYGAAVQYGSPQPYATVYVPTPPQWSFDPNTAPVQTPADHPYTPTGPYARFGSHTASNSHAASSPYADFGSYGATGPFVASGSHVAPNPYATARPYATAGPYSESGAHSGSGAHATAGPLAANGPNAGDAYVAGGMRPAGKPRVHLAGAAGRSWDPEAAGGGGVAPRLHARSIASPGVAGPSWAGQNCTVVFTDIAGFSSRVRDESDRIEVRQAMYAALRESFAESGVPWDACYSEDRGDGALIVVPPEMPTAAVVDPLIAVLGMRLRRHNHRSSEALRIQLRVAVDVGPVMPDPPGVSGWTIITAARMVDAAPLKERLAATGADLGVIASRFVYDSVIAHSPGYVNAAEYEPIGCKVKETDIEGWIHLHGLPARSAI